MSPHRSMVRNILDPNCEPADLDFEDVRDTPGSDDDAEFEGPGGGARKSEKVGIDITRPLEIGREMEGDPVGELVKAAVGTKEIPVTNADKAKKLAGQVWTLFCCMAANEVFTDCAMDEASRFVGCNVAFRNIYQGNFKLSEYWGPEFYEKFPDSDLPVCVDTFIQHQL